MRLDFTIGTLACLLTGFFCGCAKGVCSDLSNPPAGSCTCSNGQQLAPDDCDACDGKRSVDLGQLEKQNARGTLLSVCGREYDFELASDGQVLVVVSDVSGGVTASINGTDGAGAPITTSASPGTDGNVTAVLPQGAYALKLATGSGTSVSYKLALSAQAYDAMEPDGDPGSDADHAADLGTLDSLTRSGGFVGPTDAVDYYRFELKQNSTLTLAVTDVAGRVHVQLYSDATLIDETKPHLQFDVDSTKDSTQSMNLEKGVYYLRFTPLQGAASLYKLGLSAQPYQHPEPDPEPGASKDAAYDVGTLTELKTFGGFVGQTDPEDYYRVVLAENITLTYALSEVSGSVTAQLFPDKDLIDESKPADHIDASDDKPSTNSLNLAKGTYYVRVIPGPSSNALYTLSLVTEAK